VIDAEHGAHLADTIDPARRRSLDRIFRMLRAEASIDRTARAQLIDAIAASIETG